MDQRSGDGRFSAGENFQNFEKLDARIASALNKIIQNSRRRSVPKRGSVSTGKTDRLHGLRLLSSHWRSRNRS